MCVCMDLWSSIVTSYVVFFLSLFKFVYVNSAFSPNPDESVNDLYKVSLFTSHPFVYHKKKSLFLVLPWKWYAYLLMLCSWGFGICRTLALMVNWWLTMRFQWRGDKSLYTTTVYSVLRPCKHIFHAVNSLSFSALT